MAVEHGAVSARVGREIAYLRPVAVPRIEVHRHIFFSHLFKECVEPFFIVSADRGSADFERREPRFQILCRRCKKVIELLGRSRPALVVEVRLVPYLPIFNTHVIAVRPALVHMHYDVLADDRPFLIVLRRHNAVVLRPVLDLTAEAVKHLCARAHNRAEINIRQREVIGLGRIRVGVEIGEYIMYIDRVLSAVVIAYGRIVRSGKRDVRLPEVRQIREILVAVVRIHGAVVDGVHRLYPADSFFEIHFKLHKFLRQISNESCLSPP